MPTIFEQASRIKLRFETSKGLLTAEDLWDLPLTSQNKANLDGIAVGLFQQLQASPVSALSFVNKEQKADAKVQLAFDIVKHVIDTRLVENAAEATRRSNAEKKQRILAIIEGKEAEALGAASIDDLRAMANAL